MSEVYTKCRLLLEQLDCYVTNQALSKYEIEDDIKKLESFIAEQTQALQRRVEWTKERPTQAGKYWWRYDKHSASAFVDVADIKGELYAWSDALGYEEVRKWNGEWSNVPLEAPHEARG